MRGEPDHRGTGKRHDRGSFSTVVPPRGTGRRTGPRDRGSGGDGVPYGLGSRVAREPRGRGTE